jgi:hypothetical protein
MSRTPVLPCVADRMRHMGRRMCLIVKSPVCGAMGTREGGVCPTDRELVLLVQQQWEHICIDDRPCPTSHVLETATKGYESCLMDRHPYIHVSPFVPVPPHDRATTGICRLSMLDRVVFLTAEDRRPVLAGNTCWYCQYSISRSPKSDNLRKRKLCS